MIKNKDNFAYFSIKTENVGTRYKSLSILKRSHKSSPNDPNH